MHPDLIHLGTALSIDDFPNFEFNDCAIGRDHAHDSNSRDGVFAKIRENAAAHTTRRNHTSDKTPATSANPADNKASKAVTSVSRVCT